MYKKHFVVLITLLASICFMFGLAACKNSNLSSDRENQAVICYVEDENTDNNVADETRSDNNLTRLDQFIATLLGGLCSILGGVLAVIITSISNKNKQMNVYFLHYYKLLNNFKLDLDNSNQKNLPEIEKCIRGFINSFNNDSYLVYYIGRKYYNKDYEQFKKYLNNFFKPAFVNRFKNQEELYDSLKNRIDIEMNKVQSILN